MDFQTISHLANFLEDLGLGKNIAETGIICYEVHTNAENYKYDDFVTGICQQWKNRELDWLQVQGDGISDEYMTGKRSARGHIRWAWQAIMEAMWPKPSAVEIAPFGDEYFYKALNMTEEGNLLCKKL